MQSHVKRRLAKTFGVSPRGEPLGVLNEKAQAWWDANLATLGAALKTSFKLASNPLKNPHVADGWEPYLAENRAKVDSLARQIADAEADLNDRVYRLFNLTAEEIKLSQREVEH